MSRNSTTQRDVTRALAGALLFGEKTIIVSAHQQDTAREVFQRIVDLIDENPALADRVAPNGIMRALNREYVKFRTGATIRFKARSAPGSRGFSCDCLLLDEAQILGAAAWSSILPTMSARPNPQVWLLGTPPTPVDDGEVFTRVRAAGLEGKQRGLAYLEWSAEPGADFDDELTWAAANPSFGTRISAEAIQGERASMTDTQFGMERLGMWAVARAHDPALDLEAWAKASESPTVPAGAPDYYSLSISPERIGFIGVAFHGEDADFVDLAEAGRVDDSRKIVEWFAERRKSQPRLTVAIDSRDPAAALVNELRAARVKVNVTTQSDSARASVGFAEAVSEGRVEHVGQGSVREALSAARRKSVGKAGLWEFDPDDDISALRAVVLARYGLTFKKKRAGGDQAAGRRVSGRKVVVM